MNLFYRCLMAFPPASASVAPGGTASFTLHALPVPATAIAGKAITDTLFVTTNIPGHASTSVPISITPHGATLTLTPATAAVTARLMQAL